MLFCQPHEVDEVWGVVAKATANHELGVAAKVAPNDSDREERLVCVYTADFQNKEDVIRVLRKLRELCVDAIRRRIYYKPGERTSRLESVDFAHRLIRCLHVPRYCERQRVGNQSIAVQLD